MSIEAANKPRKEAEESSNFKEEKKKEDQQRERRNNREEEDQDQNLKLDSTVSRTMGAYLQGSGPQTGQGSAPPHHLLNLWVQTEDHHLLQQDPPMGVGAFMCGRCRSDSSWRNSFSSFFVNNLK